MKKLLGLSLLGLLSLNLLAAEDFNLQTAKTQLVNDNINVAIAYQNYVSVEEQARVKTLQILPTLTVDLLTTNDYQYTILRSVIPEPTKFFDAAAAKHMAEAASVNRTIVKKNLLEGALIVIFVLVIFLGNIRSGLIVASVIPLAMLFAVSLMKVFGVSGNLMSLGSIDF